MMQEVTSIWGSDLKEVSHESVIITEWLMRDVQTAETRFRGRGAETYLPLLATLYNIEKHREALLWSFFMARSDKDGSGNYSIEERNAMQATLGGRRSDDQHGFRVPERFSFFGTYADHFDELGLEPPKETVYKWISRDGYFYMHGLHRIFPTLDGRPSYFCKMSLSQCFGSEDFFDKFEDDGVTSQWLFTNMAFENPRCGDCIIAGLLTASGKEGLEAFLPPKSHLEKLFPATIGDGRKHVPYMGGLNKSWQGLDFSPKAVLGTHWTPRDFVIRSLQRYSYTVGKSSSQTL